MNRRVAVTTTPDRYSRWAQPLAQYGFQPVSLPTIEVRPRPRADLEGALGGADWLVITSPRVVEILWPGGGMPPVPVAAVGNRTAAAVEAAGGNVRLVGDDDGDRLVDLLSGSVTDRQLVVPHGSRADLERWKRLRREGADVHLETVYDTVPVAPGDDAVDGAVFGSPSAVEGWCLSRPLDALAPLGAIGRVTAATLRRHGGGTPVLPSRPDPQLLALAMSATLERTP